MAKDTLTAEITPATPVVAALKTPPPETLTDRIRKLSSSCEEHPAMIAVLLEIAAALEELRARKF